MALKEEASRHSTHMDKWMIRLGKFTCMEEEELGIQILHMDERYFLIQEVEINKNQNFEKSVISIRSKCGEYISLDLIVMKDERVYCRACCGKVYYMLLEDNSKK